MKYWGLNKIKNSILALTPKDAFYRKCKALSQGDSEMLKELLFEKFIARDSGDELEDDLKLNHNRDVDIEVDGDFICDYTFCDTAKDFERVATNEIDKLRKCYDRKHNYKLKVYLKYRKLTKKNGIAMPTLNDLVLYLLQPDSYQDKLKFFKELIDAYIEEITIALNSFEEDDYQLPF